MKTTLTLLACVVLCSGGINAASAAGQERTGANSESIDPNWADSAHLSV